MATDVVPIRIGPGAPAGTGGAVAVAETHISVVFFVGDRAYKLKKPVRFGFLDFSTRAARERICHREVALNRRLAPDVYLGVADVLGADGEPCDHLVVMRRMPDDRRLEALVRAGDPSVPDHLRELARLLAAFHAAAERGPGIDEAATADAMHDRWEANFEEMRPFVGPVFAADRFAHAEHLALEYLAGRRTLFEERIARGAVCDGHGDLQCGDIFCLDDGPRVLDCIEFDHRLRHGDVANDLAFLAMDLERIGGGEHRASLVRWYEEFAGERLPTTLLHHYIAYRAQVRAKVAALRWSQEGDAPAGREARAQAGALLDLCIAHLEAGRVRLVVVGGLPGTGKSTLARGLAERIGATLLRSDEVRKQLAGLAATDRTGAGFAEGIYTRDRTDQVYGEMVRRAGERAARGEPVVLDASWSRGDHRRLVRELADRSSTALVELHCECDRAIAADRLRARLARGSDVSDATPEVAAAMEAVADPWPEARTISTFAPPASVLDAAAALVG